MGCTNISENGLRPQLVAKNCGVEPGLQDGCCQMPKPLCSSLAGCFSNMQFQALAFRSSCEVPSMGRTIERKEDR